MKLKTPFYAFGAVLLLTLASCLSNDDDSEIIYLPDAEITSFSIKNDSIVKGLSAIKFSIDQKNNLIYNTDSAAYGLKLTDKVIVSYTTASGLNILNITNLADGDSAWVKSGDSIDISKPLHFRSYAATGVKKEYKVSFNIHQVDPDSICWKQVNSDLNFLNCSEIKTIAFNNSYYCFTKIKLPPTSGYSDFVFLHISSNITEGWGEPINVGLSGAVLSQIQLFGGELFACASDGTFPLKGALYKASISDNFKSWSPVTIPSEYSVKNIFGTLTVNIDVNNKKDVLVLAVEKDGKKYSAIYNGSSIEINPQYEIPDELFTGVFSSMSYARANAGRLTIAGEGAVWSTTNGLYWAKIGILPSQMQGANIFEYNNKFYLLNGNYDVVGDDQNTYTYDNTAVYTSVDEGNTWQLSPSKTYLPDGYTFREDASVVVSSDNTIYIIGGKKEGAPVTDIWKGKLNKLN